MSNDGLNLIGFLMPVAFVILCACLQCCGISFMLSCYGCGLMSCWIPSPCGWLFSLVELAQLQCQSRVGPPEIGDHLGYKNDSYDQKFDWNWRSAGCGTTQCIRKIGEECGTDNFGITGSFDNDSSCCCRKDPNHSHFLARALSDVAFVMGIVMFIVVGIPCMTKCVMGGGRQSWLGEGVTITHTDTDTSMLAQSSKQSSASGSVMDFEIRDDDVLRVLLLPKYASTHSFKTSDRIQVSGDRSNVRACGTVKFVDYKYNSVTLRTDIVVAIQLSRDSSVHGFLLRVYRLEESHLGPCVICYYIVSFVLLAFFYCMRKHAKFTVGKVDFFGNRGVCWWESGTHISENAIHVGEEWEHQGEGHNWSWLITKLNILQNTYTAYLLL